MITRWPRDAAACCRASHRNVRNPEFPRNAIGALPFSRHHSLMRRYHMVMKTVAAGVAGSLLLASAAFAAESSTTTTSTTTTRADTTAASYQGDWRASKLVGLKVYNEANENVGSINDLLTDKSGAVKAVVIGVGGFLGMGEHLVAVSFDKVKFSDQPVAYTGASNAPAGGGTAAPGTTPPSSTTTTGSTAATGTNTTTGSNGAMSPTSTTASSKSNPWYPDHAMFNASKDELKAMPEFKYSE
jgi:sporulation protein YlmC with PRC-barrel domain